MIDKKELEELYINQKKCMAQISRELKVSLGQVQHYVYKYGFKKSNKIKICEFCGKEFVLPFFNRKVKYCSRECSVRAKYKLREKQCPICGKTFQPHASTSKYCSKDCRIRATKKKYKKVCNQCGKEFYTFPSENKQFCSRKCYELGLSSGKIKCNHKRGTYEEIYGKEKAQTIREKLKACKRSDEFKEKVRKFHTGRKRSKEFCEKMRKIQASKEHRQKVIDTKRKNKTFNTSSEEKDIYTLLKERFPDTKYQYKSELYPFVCDFYIPERDLYIEYQGFWTHGGKPFDPECKNDIEILDLWKKKAEASSFYKNAINTWTFSDPLKREVVQKNQVNWLEFFTMNVFLSWFNSLE